MSAYQYLPKLTEQQLTELRDLYTEVKPPVAASFRRRRGVNTNTKMSVYRTSKWFSWTQAQRDRFRAAYPEKFHPLSIVSYFIAFPRNRGFLDRMTTWVGQQQAGTIVAYALYDNQNIVINDTKLILSAGEGVAFNLREVHEVKPTSTGGVWANLMVLQEPEDLVK